MSLNEKISAWFEPKPSTLGPPVPSSDYWYWWGENHLGYYAPDYFTDEAANARLLEAMPKPLVWKENDQWCASHSAWQPDYEPMYLEDEVVHKDRKTAVVLAFCKFAGIEEDE